MKKILAISILSIFLAGMIMPAIVFGVLPPNVIPDECHLRHTIRGGGTGCTATECVAGAKISVDTCPNCCLLDTIYTVSDWIFYLLLSAVTIMVVIGGSYYVTSAGDPEKAKKGQELIVYALVGLVIAFFARVIPAIFNFIFSNK
ncbi:pilin [Patescibacteria group bacterium]|nr:pilin [Patescibacteria group bacterium]